MDARIRYGEIGPPNRRGCPIAVAGVKQRACTQGTLPYPNYYGEYIQYKSKFTMAVAKRFGQRPDMLQKAVNIRSFEKGLADRGGWREEILHMPEIQAFFSVPFFLCPLRRRGTHFWRTFWALFGGLFVANPLPPTPFRNL